MKIILFLILLTGFTGFGKEIPSAKTKKAEALKTFLEKEKPLFDQRELQKKDLLTVLDTLNSSQNRVRERIETLTHNQQELAMAIENLSLEYEKQKQLERIQHQRLYVLLKVVYKINKEGMVRFLFYGHNLSELAGRVRILYHTLKSHGQITKALQEKAERLVESETKLGYVKKELGSLLVDLQDQEQILAKLLEQKRDLIVVINRKQHSYQTALKEYQRISQQLANVFNALPSKKESVETPEEKVEAPPRKIVKGTLPWPVPGTVSRGYGKEVNEKFGTVIYHKGLEIASDHGTPVKAVASGVVEYSGWLKGLGNVMIVHHGEGIYSLNAHLFKAARDLGSKVDQGEIIGYVGDTGNSERPGLYFEIREKGKAVNPIAYLSKESETMVN